jgi:hypothetical protein
MDDCSEYVGILLSAMLLSGILLSGMFHLPNFSVLKTYVRHAR